jgi:23S rRNA (cytidine2498-2'-O)-methyltransferase
VTLCRPGDEALALAELRERIPHGLRCPAAPEGVPAQGAGWVAWQPPPGAGVPTAGELAFERQRLPAAAFLPADAPGALAAALLRAAMPRARTAPAPLVLQAFAADPTGAHSVSRLAARLEQRLRAAWADAGPSLGAGVAVPGGSVWQVCAVEGGVWWALAPSAALADPHPGGMHRMARDAAAPSRSVLKILEALEVLGRAPRPRERAIDLGAAPGGWSYAFLQRGCRVLAVDNGPLKLPGLDALPGDLTHLRADGLRLGPPQLPPEWLPVDWLLSDMLVAPGVCLGLLRKWIGSGWMRRFIVNVKLPQREPVVALRPLRDYLGGVPGLSWRMRQLYHDRREVTVMGELAPATVAAPTRARRASGAQAPPPGAPRPSRRAQPTRRGAPAGKRGAPSRRRS